MVTRFQLANDLERLAGLLRKSDPDFTYIGRNLSLATSQVLDLEMNRPIMGNNVKPSNWTRQGLPRGHPEK